MMSFRYKMYAPPGGKWFYTVPETGKYFESRQNMSDCEAQVLRHYAVNKLTPPENLSALIENHICLHVTPGFCLGPDPRSKSEIPPTFFEIVQKLEQFFREKRRALVSTREADQRATTCARCPENSLAFCMSCSGLRGRARSFVAGRSLAQDNYLGVCKKTRLPCGALVHLVEPPPAESAPANCWIKP